MPWNSDKKPEANNKLWRFYMKMGGEANVTIVSSEPFTGKEYCFKLPNEDGTYSKFITYEPSDDSKLGARNPIRNIPQPKFKQNDPEEKVRYPFEQDVAILLVINHTPYTDKKGVQHSDSLQLLGLHSGSKKNDEEWFKAEAEDYNGSLFGLNCRVKRSASDSTSSKIGNNWKTLKKYSQEELEQLYPEQMARVKALTENGFAGLREMFKPKTYQELLQAYGGFLKEQDKSVDPVEPEEDEDIPF